jgi:hypothetical protein
MLAYFFALYWVSLIFKVGSALQLHVRIGLGFGQ